MAQTVRTGGFRYPYPLTAVFEPWRAVLRDGYDKVISDLTERGRLLEDWTDIGPVFDQVIIEESTTSTVETDLATVGPTVTLQLPRGICTIHSGAYVTSTVTNQSAVVTIFMDGAFLQDSVILGNNTAGSLSASLSSTVMFDNLVPGTHTFQLKYFQTLGGATARFDARFLQVTPII